MSINESLSQIRKQQLVSPTQALENLDKIKFNEVEDVELRMDIFREYIQSYMNLGDYQKVLEYLSRIKEQLPKSEEIRNTIYYYKVKGIVEIEQGDFSHGIDTFHHVLELAQELNNKQVIYNELINLGIVYYNFKDHPKSLEYFNQAKKLAEGTDFDQTKLLMNLIACLAKNGNFDEAISTGVRLEKLLRDRKDLLFLVSCYINLGIAYKLKGDYEQAIQYFTNSMDYARETKQENRIYEINYYLSGVYQQIGNYEEAIELLKGSIDYADKKGKLSDHEKSLRELAECYYQIGSYKEAYQALVKSDEIERNIIDEETKDKIARYQAKLEVEHNLKEKEQLLLLYARQAEMGQMISAIAHQWRQPLNALSIIFDSIYDAWEYHELNEESLQTKLKSGKELVFSMNNTINDFRTFFKEKQQCDIFNAREVIEKAVRFTDYRFRDHDIKLALSIKDNCLLFGSSNQLLQVILIILNNAFDAFKNQAVKSPVVSIRHEIENDYSVIRITDNAGGIPAEIMEKIFESNFSTKADNENSGIGLYLAKMIIELKFNGFISVDNKNNGAAFTLRIPIPADK